MYLYIYIYIYVYLYTSIAIWVHTYMPINPYTYNSGDLAAGEGVTVHPRRRHHVEEHAQHADLKAAVLFFMFFVYFLISCIVFLLFFIWRQQYYYTAPSMMYRALVLLHWLPVSVNKNTPLDKKTGWKISFENTKSGAGLQFLLQGHMAKAHGQGVLFHRHRFHHYLNHNKQND